MNKTSPHDHTTTRPLTMSQDKESHNLTTKEVLDAFRHSRERVAITNMINAYLAKKKPKARPTPQKKKKKRHSKKKTEWTELKIQELLGKLDAARRPEGDETSLEHEAYIDLKYCIKKMQPTPPLGRLSAKFTRRPSQSCMKEMKKLLADNHLPMQLAIARDEERKGIYLVGTYKF